MNTRGTPRNTLSLRYGGSHSRTLAERTPPAAMIPAIELRRLVASMVD